MFLKAKQREAFWGSRKLRLAVYHSLRAGYVYHWARQQIFCQNSPNSKLEKTAQKWFAQCWLAHKFAEFSRSMTWLWISFLAVNSLCCCLCTDNIFKKWSCQVTIAVIGVELAVKYSFVYKGTQTRLRGQYKAELTPSPRLHVKPLITAIRVILERLNKQTPPPH